MDTLKVGMKDEQVWEVTDDLCTTRGEYRVFSTPAMTRFVEMTAHKMVGPHLKPGQGQVGVRVNIRHMAPTPAGKKVRCEVELTEIDPVSDSSTSRRYVMRNPESTKKNTTASSPVWGLRRLR